MKWEKVRLGDIADFRNGINFGKEAYGKGVRLIGVSNFGDRLFPEYKSLDEVKENVVRENDYLCSGDIVFVRSNGNKGLVGRCLLIDSPQDKVTYSGFCIRARINDVSKHYPLFWTYHFKDKAFRKAMSGTAVGANIQNLSQERLAAYEANIPDYKSQVRIADILSSYDKLIENNQKQIKLLEESAQRLYKEWFVDLRFPGYENVKIVNGVPEGWRKELIGDVFTTVLGGTPARSNAAYWGGDIPWINSGEVNNLRIMKESECITELGLKKSSAKLMPKHTTVLAITGATLGQVSYTEIETCANQSVVGIIDENEVYSIYLYLYVSDKIWDIIGKATGGAQQHINKDIVMEYTIVLPDENIIARLNAIVEPYFMKIDNMYIQNTKLLEARDRLLPKLMSSELEV